MGEIEPKLKVMILGIPTLVLVLIGAVVMSTSEDLSLSFEALVLIAPLGLGIGWMILNVYHVSEEV